MNRLPKETFSLIMSHLDIKDKLTCICVCSSWYDTICRTNLYQELNFIGHTDQLNSAFALFYENECYGRQVTHLSLRNCFPDMFITLTLPKLLPNVKYLKWDNWMTTNSKFKNNDIPPKPICDLAFKCWSRLEHVVIRMKVTDFPMIIFLLGSNIKFMHLTRLDVEISPAKRTLEEIYLKRRLGRELIMTLNSAPALVQLRLGYAAIDFEDMELINECAPQLEQLELSNAILNTGYRNHITTLSHDRLRILDQEGQNIIKSFNQGLKSLKVGIEAYALSAWTNIDFQQTVVMWMIYLGTKYLNIESLALGRTGYRYTSMPPEVFAFEQPLAVMIESMQHLTSYNVELHPLSRPVLNSYRQSDSKLTSLTLYTDYNTYETRLYDLKEAMYKKQCIESFTLIQTNAMDGHPQAVTQSKLTDSLFQLWFDMPHLTELKIDSSLNINPLWPDLLVYITKYLPQVQILHLSHLDFSKPITKQDIIPIQTNKEAQPSQLKQLVLSIGTLRSPEHFQNTNTFLNFALLNCLVLQEIKVNGEIAVFDASDDNELRFDFMHLEELKKISIHIFGASYYKLNIDGKKDRRWLDFQKPFSEDDKEAHNVIDLSWIEEKVSTIHLSPA